MKIIYITILFLYNINSLRLDKGKSRNENEVNNIANKIIEEYKKSFTSSPNSKIELVSDDKSSQSKIILIRK
jgi:hypothetical protein